MSVNICLITNNPVKVTRTIHNGTYIMCLTVSLLHPAGTEAAITLAGPAPITFSGLEEAAECKPGAEE